MRIAPEQEQPQGNAPSSCRNHSTTKTCIPPYLSNRFGVESLICHPACPPKPSGVREHSDAQPKGLVRRLFAVLLIIVAVTASYAPAARDGFVWDDTALVLRDPLIRSWRLIPEGFNHYLFVDATPSDFYRPLQRITYTIEYAFFCVNPAPYHLTNILLHAAAAVALMFFGEALLRLLGVEPRPSRGIALIGALIWAIHPVQSAAVIYVAGRADPLAALFGFIGCYLALRSLQAKPRSAVILMVASGSRSEEHT